MVNTYSDIDRLILERWDDVMALIESHDQLQKKIEQTIELVGDRLERWAGPQGYVVEASSREGEYYAWPTGWADKRKGPRLRLVLGGFCPIGFRRVTEAHPYLWLYTNNLEIFKVKEPERRAFGQALRLALGSDARSWEGHDVDDADSPLGRYLNQYDNVARAGLVADSDALFLFCTEHFPRLFDLVPIIQPELEKVGR